MSKKEGALREAGGRAGVARAPLGGGGPGCRLGAVLQVRLARGIEERESWPQGEASRREMRLEKWSSEGPCRRI